MSLIFVAEKNRKLIIVDDVVKRLCSYQQTQKRHKEAGGLLIGRHLLKYNHLVVDQITEPTRWDKRWRNFFFRSQVHNRLVYKAWCESENTQTLIGLWHTHPEPDPIPSSVDFKDWRKTLAHGDFEGDHLVFIIVGTQRIRAWKGYRNKKFNELKRMFNEEL